jgi:SAF domain-containing protein
MCLGAVVSAFAFMRASHSQQVVAVANTIHAGQTVSGGDLELVDMNSDSELRTIPASQESTVVGQIAQLDIAAGSIVTPDSFGQGSIPAKGQAVVGLSLTPAQMPASSITVGDQVSLVAVGDDNSATFSQDTATIDGTVVAVSAPNVSGSAGVDPQTGNSVVDVSVPTDTAGGLAAKAANGKVALVLDARDQ